jgi:biotin carboxyl carrier protein
LAGVVLTLVATRTTLNVQSFMGAIMAIGVAVANAILLVTFAESARRRGVAALRAAIDAARARMRPVLMTSAAMIAGMIPMALAIGEGRRSHGAAGPGRDRRSGGGDARHADRPAVDLLARAAVGAGDLALARSRRSGKRLSRRARTRMNRCAAFACALTLTACGRGASPATQTDKPAPSGPPTIEVVQIVEKPLDVTLDMPGELEAFETVAIVPRVTGFVKTIRVDRGSRVRAGQLLVELDAPELLAHRAEAHSKLQGADAQMAAVRSKADGDSSTYEKLKAASATPGVVAGNDLVIAQKAVEANQNQIASAQQNVEAARQALNAIAQLEGYLKVTAPFDGIVTERNVHPGALVGPEQRIADAACGRPAPLAPHGAGARSLHRRRVRGRCAVVHGAGLSWPDVFRHAGAHFAQRRREDANDGD